MTYEPTEWKTGDVVTSAKLNKLEQGVADASGGGVLVVHMTLDDQTGTATMDKTAGEIYQASQDSVVCLKFVFSDELDGGGAATQYLINQFSYSPDSAMPFEFLVYAGENVMTFLAATADDYPTATEG